MIQEAKRARPRFVFADPPPIVGDLVWAYLIGRRRVQGTLLRRTKKRAVIRPDGGANDITIEKP